MNMLRAQSRRFATMDANKDGKVTWAEMKASYQRITGQKAKNSDMTAADKIKVVDKDGDGMLTARRAACCRLTRHV